MRTLIWYVADEGACILSLARLRQVLHSAHEEVAQLLDSECAYHFNNIMTAATAALAAVPACAYLVL